MDPPPFAFKQEAKLTVAEIEGRITLDGGSSFESPDVGDKVIVHSQGNTSNTTGTLTTKARFGLDRRSRTPASRST